MTEANTKKISMRVPVFQGILPIKGSQVPTDIIAGITLAALAIPEVMGYTKIAGTPVITGLYTMLSLRSGITRSFSTPIRKQ